MGMFLTQLCGTLEPEESSQMQRPRTRYARCGDVSIAYQVIGQGPIDLVYAPPWLNNVEYAWESPDYARFLTKLARFSRLIFFDKRGTGLSDREVGVPTLEQRSEDISTVLDAVGSKNAALLGASEGGNMACMFAATHPERTTALVLFGCAAKRSWAPDYPWGARPEEFESFITHMLENWGEPFDLGDGAPSAANDAAAREWFAAYLRNSAGPKAAERITRLNYEIDVRAILPTIRTPTLVLHREGDRWADVAEGQYLAKHIPDAEFRMLQGNDHIPFYGNQDQAIGEIEEFLTGMRKTAWAERALLTLVMTDIVHSTRSLSVVGDERWKSMLEQLDTMVRRRINSLGGEEIKHTGDGYLLAFTGPTRALECARALAGDAASLGLALRTGVHTGECERRNHDLTGMAVHLAARIMNEAEPGMILTSGTVKDLVVGSGLEFEPQGEREMKGVPGRWSLFRVIE